MRVTTLYIILISPAIAFAQPHFENLSSTIPASKELYLGVDNHTTIAGISNLPKKQSITVSHGETFKTDNGSYIIRVTSVKPDTLKLYLGGKLVLSEIFTVKTIPQPIGRLGNSLDTILTPGQVLANPFISVITPGCNYKYIARVVSFLVSFITSNGETVADLPQNGYLLSEYQVKEIRKLKPRDKIFFSNLRYNTPDGRTVPLEPFTVVIK